MYVGTAPLNAICPNDCEVDVMPKIYSFTTGVNPKTTANQCMLHCNIIVIAHLCYIYVQLTAVKIHMYNDN